MPGSATVAGLLAHCWHCGKLVRLAATATASARTSRTLTIPQAWAAMALLVSDWGVAASRNDLPSYFHLALLAAPRTHGFLLAVLQPSVLAMRNEERGLPGEEGCGCMMAGWMHDGGLNLGALDRGWRLDEVGLQAVERSPLDPTTHACPLLPLLSLPSRDPCCCPCSFPCSFALRLRHRAVHLGRECRHRGACVGSRAPGQSEGRL